MKCPCKICAHINAKKIFSTIASASQEKARALSGLAPDAFQEAIKVHRMNYRAPAAKPIPKPTPAEEPTWKDPNPLPRELRNIGHEELLWWIVKEQVRLGKSAEKGDLVKTVALRDARETLGVIRDLQKANEPLLVDPGQEGQIQKTLMAKLDAFLIAPPQSNENLN